jgi:murein peptide amidase A
MGAESTVGRALVEAAATLGGLEVGRSTLGHPIRALHAGAGAGAPLLVIGGVHGDEPSSVAAVIELSAWLNTHPPRREVWSIPVLNPDGTLAGTKNSARDVDLNRNFPASNFSTEHRPGYFPGAAPLSEPESAALAALIDRVQPVGVVAVHAPFACVNHDGPAAEWAAEVARACGWPAQADIGYPTPGSLGSWLGRDRGLPVLTLELPPGAYQPFRREAQRALQTAINPERIG